MVVYFLCLIKKLIVRSFLIPPSTSPAHKVWTHSCLVPNNHRKAYINYKIFGLWLELILLNTYTLSYHIFLFIFSHVV